MNALEKLIKTIKENPISHKKEWEQLRDRIMSVPMHKEDLLLLSRDIKEFFHSDATEEDKEHLRMYTECLSMLKCAAGL